MILPITIIGTSVLRQIAEEIDETYPDLQQLIDDMFETMHSADGVGLAAPQVDKAIRLFVIDATPMAEDDPELDGFVRVFINPIIEEETGDDIIFQEGCLSIPGIREDVKRKSKIRISYCDRNMELHEEWFDGWKARIIQHEYDHLEGILFTDNVSLLRKKMLKAKLNAVSNGAFDASYKVKVNRVKR